MRLYKLYRQTKLPVPVKEAWNFFSDPSNLKKITPPEMRFEVLSENLPERIYSGMLIQYSVSPLTGLRMNWVTEIKNVNEPFLFIDEQRFGPYRFWFHEHSFIENGNETIMTDTVYYALPLGILGRIVNFMLIKRRLNYIFDFRKKIISRIFDK
jgi:ligand-binding SRPBCC domain-containing protein